MSTRQKTKYPGIFFREAQRLGGNGTEKVFYIVFKKNGRVIEEKVGRQYADNMTEAKANAVRGERLEGKRESRKAIREQEQAEREAQANRPTIARLWELYKEARPDLKGIATDQNRFEKHLAPTFGQKTPGEIDPLSVDRFRVTLGKTRAPATVANALELLRRLVNFGVRRGLCEPPRTKIRLPKVDNQTTENLSPDQLQRLLTALDTADNQPVAAIMKLALYSGLRRGELLGLEWRDVDFERNFIRLRSPKGGKTVSVPMNGQARALLESLPRESDYVFPGRHGGRRIEVRKACRKICGAAGLPSDFRGLHGLRHSFASALASSGQVDMYVLQRLLTHKSPIMTQRYAHLADAALQRASDVASRLMGGTEPIRSPQVVNMEKFRQGSSDEF